MNNIFFAFTFHTITPITLKHIIIKLYHKYFYKNPLNNNYEYISDTVCFLPWRSLWPYNPGEKNDSFRLTENNSTWGTCYKRNNWNFITLHTTTKLICELCLITSDEGLNKYQTARYYKWILTTSVWLKE